MLLQVIFSFPLASTIYIFAFIFKYFPKNIYISQLGYLFIFLTNFWNNKYLNCLTYNANLSSFIISESNLYHLYNMTVNVYTAERFFLFNNWHSVNSVICFYYFRPTNILTFKESMCLSLFFYFFYDLIILKKQTYGINYYKNSIVRYFIIPTAIISDNVLRYYYIN
jgi:hypothetical protein